jgi:hypothetical protein
MSLARTTTSNFEGSSSLHIFTVDAEMERLADRLHVLSAMPVCGRLREPGTRRCRRQSSHDEVERLGPR